MANTSGQGSTVVVPDEIKGWNWGAFLLTFIWGAGNKVWSSALVGVPGIGAVVPFVIGVKGSEWAWQNKEWKSVEHFKQVQRKWAIWGFATSLITILVFAAIALNGGFDDEDDAYLYEDEAPGLSEPAARNERTAPVAPPRPSTAPAAAIVPAAPAASPVVAPPTALPVAVETTRNVPMPVAAPSAGKASHISEITPPALSNAPQISNAPRRTYAAGDLRECLDRPTNEDIARCAEQF